MPLENMQESAPDNTKRNQELTAQIQACKTYRRKLIQSWTTNIDYRRGKPFASHHDEDRIVVNVDWALTKQKQALLFSQVPSARLSHPPQTISKEMAWVHSFEQRINDTAVTAGIETAMDECLPDCINAAGIGIVMATREALTEMVEVPAIDLEMLPPEIAASILQSGLLPDGTELPMETIPRETDSRYRIFRVSPGDFLWPISFTGSDFDNAPFIGRSGKLPWAEAMKRFDLQEADKRKYCGTGDEVNPLDKLSYDSEKEKSDIESSVTFDELFLKEHLYNPSETSFGTIRHVVFLAGQPTPILDEQWKGQKKDEESGQLIGALKYPIRVLSLAYISDESIPPSDSAIGRPQVNELNKSRTQMILQRERSMPLRTFDVNRLDPAIQTALMRGVWQHMIPVQGNGQNIITEVSRAHMPQENFTFDRIAKTDLSELWQTGQGAVGHDVETKSEVEAITTNMQTRIGRERAKVGKFFCSIIEVLGGLISIYEDPSSFGEGFSPLVSRTLSYSILADSTVLLDSNQRLEKAKDFFDFTAKTGWVDPEPVLREIAALSGFDPSTVIKPPPDSKPDQPNMSLRLTGTEDLLNPLALAFLIKSGQAPDQELIEQAKKLIEVTVTPPPMSPAGPILPGAPMPGSPEALAMQAEQMMGGPMGQPMLPGLGGMGAPPPDFNVPPLPPGTVGPMPNPPPPDIGDANPTWSKLNPLSKRKLER